MWIYIITSFLLLLFSFIEIFLPKKINATILFYFTSLGLFLLSFLRWDVGTDWDSYMFIYNYAESFDYMERGFILINIVAKKIFDSYTMALFLQAAILFTFQTIAVKKISPLPMTTLMIMWGTDFCNVFFVRQSVAISLLFFSILAIRYRKIGLFLLLVLLATSIHRASLAFLPAYWLYYWNISKKQIIIFFVISLICGSLFSVASVFENFGTFLT